MTRAVIYCRVSTEDEIQINALEKQIEEAKLSVSKNKWILVDEYIDEGKSGTMTKHRDEYNRLFRDLESDKFDIVVIKSQDRLMRSTKDWYLFVDKLVQNTKKLYFYLENKFYSSDDALITGIKAILAEEYSRELSKKINNAHYHRQQNKGNVLITSRTWGYKKVGKEVVIDEEEAIIVRMIFDLCANGYGTRTISKILTNQNYFNHNGTPFTPTTIRRIIRNPLFKGTAIMNKIHYDFDSKKSIRNNKDQWIYKENAVPPIIDEETWEKANKTMDKNLECSLSEEAIEKMRGVKRNAHPLTGKIICGECGAKYWKQHYQNVYNNVVTWRCSNYVCNGKKTPLPHSVKKIKVKSKQGCDNQAVNCENLENALKQVAKQFYNNKEDILFKAITILKSVLQNQDDTKLNKLITSLENANSKRKKLLDKYLDGVIQEDIYKSKDLELETEIEKLNNEISKEKINRLDVATVEEKIEIIKKEIEKIINEELALNFLYQHITQVTVYTEKIIVEYDIFPKTEIIVNRINYRKVILSVCDHN